MRTLAIVSTLVLLVLVGPVAEAASRTFVFTAVLVADPDLVGDPNQIVGTLQLLVTQAVGDPDVFQAIGQAHLVKRVEPYTTGLIAHATGAVIVNMGDPEEVGDP